MSPPHIMKLFTTRNFYERVGHTKKPYFSLTLTSEVSMDAYEAEEKKLQQERRRTLRKAGAVQQYVNMLITRKQEVPDDIRDILGSHQIRLEEIAHLLRQLKAQRPIDPKKVIGHIDPETLSQPLANRAEFARQFAHGIRLRRRSKWER